MHRALHFAAPIVETAIGLTLLAIAVDSVIQGRRWLRSQQRVDVLTALKAAAERTA